MSDDPDLGKISEGHVCKHGIRWPWQCHECDRAVIAALKSASPEAEGTIAAQSRHAHQANRGSN